MAGEPGETGELTLRYPVFAVVTEQEDGYDGLVVVDVGGQECVPLFRQREVAELYVSQAQDGDSERPFRLREVGEDDELDHMLAQLPPSVGHVVWDPTAGSQAVRLTAVADLRRVLGDTQA